MPELPEVETIMQGLRPVLEGGEIAHVQINRPDLRRPFPPHLKQMLEGGKVRHLRRRAKYILCDVSTKKQEEKWTLLIHLGMSGRIFIDSPGTSIPPRMHEHLILTTKTGHRITLVDPRRFGLVDMFRTGEAERHPLLASLGVDPLDSCHFTPQALKKAFAGRISPIKTVLLDQKHIAGLGNIYVCEALFRAGLHPQRPAQTLNDDEISRLWMAIPQIMEEAIAAGGSSLRDYVHTDGTRGDFQTLHRVYGREGKGCPFCPGKGICPGIQRIVQGGRSTFFCPHKQQEVGKNSPGSSRNT